MNTEQLTHFRWYWLSANQDRLHGKVVFIIGYDTAVLQSLVTQLAQKGADIVLLCRQLPQEIARTMIEMVQFYGRRLFIIEQIEQKTVVQSQVIETIKNKLGRLDIFIDLSAQKIKLDTTPLTNETRFSPPNWSFTWAFLEDLADKP